MYKNKFSISRAAQVEVDKAKIEQSGTVGWLAWRSVYLAKQVHAASVPRQRR
jgi:hypothetical protein